MSGSAPGGRRRPLDAVLVRHGLPLAVAQRVRTLGQALRDETLRHRVEFAALVEAGTGDQLGGTVSGREDEVDLGPLLRQRAPGATYVCLHTHPASMPLSIADVAFLLEARYVCLVTAVGRDGAWYVISAEPDAPPADIAALRATFAQVAEATAPDYQVPPYATEREARRAHLHVIWQQAAPRLGLRYDQVQGRVRR